MSGRGRLIIVALLATLAGACAGAPPVAPTAPEPVPLPLQNLEPPSDPPPASPSWSSCRPQDVAVSVWGTIWERTLEGSNPLGGATVELYHGGAGTAEDALRRGVVNSVTTGASGRYRMCLPPSDGAPGPNGGAGLSAPGGEVFVLRVVKAGYREVSHAFRESYGHWDYHDSAHNLETTRE